MGSDRGNALPGSGSTSPINLRYTTETRSSLGPVSSVSVLVKWVSTLTRPPSDSEGPCHLVVTLKSFPPQVPDPQVVPVQGLQSLFFVPNSSWNLQLVPKWCPSFPLPVSPFSNSFPWSVPPHPSSLFGRSPSLVSTATPVHHAPTPSFAFRTSVRLKDARTTKSLTQNVKPHPTDSGGSLSSVVSRVPPTDQL